MWAEADNVSRKDLIEENKYLRNTQSLVIQFGFVGSSFTMQHLGT